MGAHSPTPGAVHRGGPRRAAFRPQKKIALALDSISILWYNTCRVEGQGRPGRATTEGLVMQERYKQIAKKIRAEAERLINHPEFDGHAVSLGILYGVAIENIAREIIGDQTDSPGARVLRML